MCVCVHRDDWNMELDDSCFLEMESRIGLDPHTHTTNTTATDTDTAQHLASLARDAQLVLPQVVRERLREGLAGAEEGTTEVRALLCTCLCLYVITSM